MKWVLTVLVLLAACNDPAGTQYLPIGSRCGSAGQCGTVPYACNASGAYAFGYCEKPCRTVGDCPADAVCNPGTQACRRKCKANTDCRTADGYGCVALNTTESACEPSSSPSPMDGGQP